MKFSVYWNLIDNMCLLHKKTELSIVPFFLMILIIGIKIALSYYTFGVGVEFDRWLFLISAFIMILCLYQAYTSYSSFKIYTIILVSLFILGACFDLSYSVIDETANFEYIIHIIDTGVLPVMGDQWNAAAINSVNFSETTPNTINYEAVQAPFYHLFLALLGGFTENNTVRFISFRITGLLFVVFVVYLYNKLTKILFDISVSNSKICRLFVLLLILCPGYLYRASRLNNEIMGCLIFIVLLYHFFKSFSDDKTYRYVVVSFLSVLLFLTKNTSIYGMLFPFLLFVFHICDRRKKTVLFSFMLCALIVVPWFKFNFDNYHALNGLQKHFEFVLPIVNPDHLRLNSDLIEGFFAILPGTFFGGHEFQLHTVTIAFISFIYIVFLIIFGNLIYKTALAIFDYRRTSEYLSQHNQAIVNILVNLACLVTMVFSTYVLKYINETYKYKFVITTVIIIIGLTSLVYVSTSLFRLSLIIAKSCIISFTSFKNFDPFDKKNMCTIINITCVSVIILAVIVLIAGSLVSSVYALIGRYLYPVIPALCILLLNNMDSVFSENIKKSIKISAIIMMALISVDVFSGLINKSMSYRGWLADGTIGFNAKDVTDGNWNKGVLRDGKQLLLSYSTSTNYSLLRDRVFSNNGELAYVDHGERDGQFVRLYLKNKVSIQNISSTTWQNIDNYSLKRYNFYGDQFPLGKINGSTLSQSFVVKSADSLLGFSVIMATYGQPPLTVNVDYKIVDSNNGSEVAKGQRVLEGVNDNQWVDVLFQKPVSVKKDGKYRIEFTLNNSEDKMLTVYAIRNNVYKDGELTADIPGLEKDIDLSFGLIQN